jgi:ankyrin repeat protein
MMDLLLRYEGAREMLVSAEDKEQETPLFYACHKGQFDVVKYLDKLGADLEHKEFQNRTPLYVYDIINGDNVIYRVACKGNKALLAYFLERGCDPN